MGKFSALGLNVSVGVKMPIIHPGASESIKDKGGREAYLELLSDDSAAGRKFSEKMRRRAIDKLKKSRAKDVDEDDLQKIQVDKIVSLLTGWYIVAPNGEPILENGEPVKCSEENARELLSDPEMGWLLDQALIFVADGANFTKASSPT